MLSVQAVLHLLQAAQQAPKPLYDPNGPDAIVLNESEWARGEGKDAKGRQVVAVVVDPYLGRCALPVPKRKDAYHAYE